MSIPPLGEVYMNTLIALAFLMKKLLWVFYGMFALAWLIIILVTVIVLLLVVYWVAGLVQRNRKDELLGEGQGAGEQRRGDGN